MMVYPPFESGFMPAILHSDGYVIYGVARQVDKPFSEGPLFIFVTDTLQLPAELKAAVVSNWKEQVVEQYNWHREQGIAFKELDFPRTTMMHCSAEQITFV